MSQRWKIHKTGEEFKTSSRGCKLYRQRQKMKWRGVNKRNNSCCDSILFLCLVYLVSSTLILTEYRTKWLRDTIKRSVVGAVYTPATHTHTRCNNVSIATPLCCFFFSLFFSKTWLHKTSFCKGKKIAGILLLVKTKKKRFVKKNWWKRS